jgi:fructokinase
MSDLQYTTKTMSVWGSGLLAVDIIIRSKDGEVIEITAGGTCSNVLAGLAIFGWCCIAKGRIGNDPAGRILVEELNAGGVDTSSLWLSDTIQTPLIIERFGMGNDLTPEHKFEWMCPSCGAAVPRFRPTPIGILNRADKDEEQPDVFFFDRPTPGNIKLAQSLRCAGTIIMFEPPNLRDNPKFDQAIAVSDIVKVAGSGKHSLLEARLVECPLAIITYGTDGLEYRVHGFRGMFQGWRTLAATPLVRSIDSCGSGDWLTAGFLHSLFGVNDLTDESLSKIGASLKFGQALAALNCLLPGARGLSRAFSRVEISEMVGVSLAKGLAGLEGRVVQRSGDLGKRRDVQDVCGSCQN